MEIINEIFSQIILNKEMIIQYYIIGLAIYLLVGLLFISRIKEDRPTKAYIVTSPIYPFMIIMIVIAIMYGAMFMESKK